MLDIKRHFLESNIIIGFSVEWDNQSNICSTYKEETSDKHWFSSKKVIEYEVEPIINGLRQDLETLIEKCIVSSTADIEDLKDKTWDIIPDIDERKYQKISRYIEYKSSEFSKFVNEEKGADKMLLMIDSDFRDPVKFVYGIKDDSRPIMYLPYNPEDHIQRYRKVYSKINREINHEDDTEVLLDAHHFSVQEEDEVAFITTDKEHLVSNKNKIESVLTNVEIFNPQNNL